MHLYFHKCTEVPTALFRHSAKLVAMKCVGKSNCNKLLLLLLLLNAIALSPGGSGYFTCIQNMKMVTNKFKPVGLHEKHVVATWNLGNHLSICL